MTKANYQQLSVRRTPPPDFGGGRGAVSCSRCRNTGFRLTVDAAGNEAVRPCECRAERDALRQISVRERAANIPPRYLSATFETFRPSDPSQSQARAALERLVKRYPTGERGVILMGAPGTGKTHLAVAAIRELMRKKHAACVFVDCVKYLADLQAKIGAAPTPRPSQEGITKLPSWEGSGAGKLPSWEGLGVGLFDADIIVLDDLGSYKLTAWAQDQIGLIIGERYNRQKLTIITTNYLDRAWQTTPDETLEDRIGQRLRSRLAEMCEPLRVAGPDYRRR